MSETTRKTIGDLLGRTARRHPDKLAIRCGRVDWRYAAFDAICNRLAAGRLARMPASSPK